MNHRPQKHEQTKDRITHLEFEAWPASGLTPNRYCFLHTFFTQCLEKAKNTDDLNQTSEKCFRMN